MKAIREFDLALDSDRESLRAFLGSFFTDHGRKLPVIGPKRRVFHMVPAHKTDYLEIAQNLRPDILVLDWEDSVPNNLKLQAYENSKNFSIPNGVELWVRVNQVSHSHFKDEANLVKEISPNAVLLPKVEDTYQLAIAGNAFGSIEIVPTIETIAGMNRAMEIISFGGIKSVAFGAEDFYAELSTGLQMMDKGDIVNNQIDRERYLGFVQQLAMVCVKYNVQLLDGVHKGVHNLKSDDPIVLENLKQECILVRGRGACGKASIQPIQIEIIKKCFDIDLKQVVQALDIVENINDDCAIRVVNGCMEGPPKLLPAWKLLQHTYQCL